MSISINTSMICLSLAYLNGNYSSVSKVSKWIFNELSEIKYNDDKLLRSLNNKDTLITESIIHLVKDKSIVEGYLFTLYTKTDKKRKGCRKRVSVLEDKKYFSDIIKLIIDKNIVNIHYKKDFLIKITSSLGQIDIVKFLIENGADIHARDNFPLRMASRYGHIDIVRLLIDNGANIHTRNDHVLKLASCYNHIDLVKLLLENGADVHAQDDFALRVACENNNYDIVKLLIDNGANIHIRNNHVLKLATEGGHHRIVTLLVNKLFINN